MGKPLCLHGKAVQRPRHDEKRPMAALRRLVAEFLRKVKQPAKLSASHHFHDPPVVFRPFLPEAVGPVLRQPVGQISAGDDRHPFSGPHDRPLNALSQPVMHGKGQAGKPDAHRLIVSVIPVQEPERDHRPVIQPSVLLSHGSRGNIRRVRLLRDQPHKLRVILRPHLRMRRAEASEIPFRLRSRRNMKIVRIHDRMGRQHRHRIRLPGSQAARRLMVCVDGSLNPFFLPPSHLRNDQRRMRHHNCSCDRHGKSSLLSFTGSRIPRGYILRLLLKKTVDVSFVYGLY